MPQIQNSSTIKEIRSISGSSISEGFAQQVSSKEVQLVANVNPKDYRISKILVATNYTGTSGSVSAYTTHASKLTYITSVIFSVSKDATYDGGSAQFGITGVINSVTNFLAGVACLTLTSERQTVVVSFDRPVLVDRNSSLSISSASNTVGSCIRTCSVAGYEVDLFEN